MKKLFVILFSFILFISCNSMNGDLKTSVQNISGKEILDVQNSQKDTVEIVINNKEGIVYIVEGDNVVGKALLDNKENSVILSFGVFAAFIIVLTLLFLIGLFAVING